MNPKELARSFSRAQVGVLLVTAAFAGVGGACAGATIAVRRLGDKLRLEADEVLQAEIAGAKEHYKKHFKAEEFETPEGALEALHPQTELEKAADAALVAYEAKNLQAMQNEFSTNPPPTAQGDLIEIARNVFTDAAVPEEFDLARELEHRDPDKPYVISEDEYNVGEFEYDQIELTYYAGDEVLANEKDEPVNIELSVGSENLLKFGYGSGDESIVYVRNAAANMDFTVVLSLGKYSEEVHGLGIDEDDELELKHFDSRPRKFRLND